MISGSAWVISEFISTGTVIQNNDVFNFVPYKQNDTIFLYCESCETTNLIQLNKLGGIVPLSCQQCGHPLDLSNEIHR